MKTFNLKNAFQNLFQKQKVLSIFVVIFLFIFMPSPKNFQPKSKPTLFIEIKYVKVPSKEFREKNRRLAHLYISAYLKLKRMDTPSSTFSKEPEEYLNVDS